MSEEETSTSEGDSDDNLYDEEMRQYYLKHNKSAQDLLASMWEETGPYGKFWTNIPRSELMLTAERIKNQDGPGNGQAVGTADVGARKIEAPGQKKEEDESEKLFAESRRLLREFDRLEREGVVGGGVALEGSRDLLLPATETELGAGATADSQENELERHDSDISMSASNNLSMDSLGR